MPFPTREFFSAAGCVTRRVSPPVPARPRTIDGARRQRVGRGEQAGAARASFAGAVSTIFTGFEQVRGLAYDPAMRRLFIIEHSATVGVPDKLHVRPLDG